MFKGMKQKLFGTGQPSPSGSTPASDATAPNDAAALLAQGDALLEQGKPGQAGKCYLQATTLNPRDAAAFLKLGRALSEQGRHEEARPAFEQALALAPDSAQACYELGKNCKERGDTGAAIAHCSRALELEPDLTACRLGLCLLFLEVGRPAEAKAVILTGIERTPDVADFHFYLGNLLTEMPTLAAAVASFKTALSLRPDYPEALGGLANALHWMGQFDAAVESYEKAIALKSDYPGVYCSLAQTLIAQGKLDTAAQRYKEALAIDPEYARAHCDLGTVLKTQGKLDEAISHYRKAVSSNPHSAYALDRLGQALFAQGKHTEAIDFFQRALKIDGSLVDPLNSLGIAFKTLNRYAESVDCFKAVVRLTPNLAIAHANLGTSLAEMALHDVAWESYKKALEIEPDLAVAQSGLLFLAGYHPDLSAEQAFAAYHDYDQRMGVPLRKYWVEHDNDRNTTRRLRVGYVSPDFSAHTVGYFLLPVFARHDKQRVEIFAYAELTREDEGTARYRAYADHWVSTAGMTDAAVAERIRADRIDILIDLAGHTANNRLGVFALKPAPVSVSWLGFGNTTGLTAIDYFLTDEVIAPPGCEHLFSEQPWRLDGPPAFVYRPPVKTMGPVGDLPALKRSHVTFGTLTRAVRINHHTVRVWARILERVPGSHLRVDSKSYKDAGLRASLTAMFAAHGIDATRLELGCHSPPWDVLRSMDIGLDCFPHNSGTTLFETLYMGIPYVTLADRPGPGRLGGSILHGIGHPEWIAKTEDEYVEIAVALASDLDALADLRSHLRAQMDASPLCDEAGFTRKMENAYRDMFARWASSSHCSTPALIAAAPNDAAACYELGKNCKERGDTSAAIVHCTRALELDPDLTACRLGLCLLLIGVGRRDEAKALIQAGIERTPEVADFHSHLGILLTEMPTLAAAVASFKTALSLRPDYPEALGGLANALHWMGQFDAAVETYEKAIALKSDYPGVYCSLAQTLIAQGKLGAAAQRCKEALAIDPGYARAHCDLGTVLKMQGKFDEAISHYRKALSINPNFAYALDCLGQAIFAQGKYVEAIDFFQRALKVDKNFTGAWNDLGLAFRDVGRYKEAADCLQTAIRLEPNLATAHANLGTVLQEQGDFAGALNSFRKALAIAPEDKAAQSNLLFAVNYDPNLSVEQVFAAYQGYDQRVGVPLRGQWAAHGNSRETSRRLKVGYVSPDFRQHSVLHFLEPLLAHHDKNAVEVYAYAELTREDATTARYRACVDHWVPTFSLSDEALADRIRLDGIDILVDLAGHTGDNRLSVFARKPAPVSVSWLGFGYTTGLTAIDYFLSDEVCAPPGSESVFSEQPWRLATPAYAYRPAEGMGPVSPLPAATRGYVTFGTLTRAVRINHRTIRVWAQILHRVPNARLRVDSKSYQDANLCTALRDKFAAHGIGPERLELGCHSPPWDVLRGMDIGLDCFPHNSGTTLFETLYMGLPYVTLADRPSVGRLGGTILHGVGHPEWIAQTEDEYVEIAVALASDLDALAGLRSGLRARMEAGPLRDEAGFARKVEAAYKDMFARWASSSPANKS